MDERGESRRAFLGKGIAWAGVLAAAPAVLASPTRSASATKASAVKSAATSTVSGPRVLVTVHLAGGNDGLNTVVPYAQKAYYAARPSLAIPADCVLPLSDELGLSPCLDGLYQRWFRDELAIVNGVGDAVADRDHYRALTAWDTATAGDKPASGWLGRYFDTVSEAQRLNASARRELGRDLSVRPSISFANLSSAGNYQPITPAIHLASTDNYPTTNFGASLKQVSDAINSGSSTRVYSLSMAGFDTHAQQARAHAARLCDLDRGLTQFCNDLEAHGQLGRVLVMVYSEFGRSLTENGARGTDHGAANPVLLLGGGVRGGLYGPTPKVAHAVDDALAPHIDYRSVYATILADWLDTDPTAILGACYPRLGFVQA